MKMAGFGNAGFGNPGSSNFNFIPPVNFPPPTGYSFPFHQSAIPPFSIPRLENTEHVFQSQSGFAPYVPRTIIPDLETIKSIPPPSIPGNIFQNGSPRNPVPVNFNFPVQSSQYQAGLRNILPPVNYSNMNVNLSNSTVSPYTLSNQQGSREDATYRTSNGFERNPAAFYGMSNTSAQSSSNSFENAGRHVRNYHDVGKAARNSKYNMKCKSPGAQDFHGGIPSSNFSNSSNEQLRQGSFNSMEWKRETSHSYNSFPSQFHNNGRNFGPKASSNNLKKIFTPAGNLPDGQQNSVPREGSTKTNNSAFSKSYTCDTCDRTFALENEMMHHLSEHVKCGSGDCQFAAHPKIVALHKKMQHETGYADRINKLKSADDIEKWRAERRRRFPTLENIKKRKAEESEKEARGEVIENKEFGKFNGQNTEKNGNRQHSGKRRRRNARNKNCRIDHPHSVSKGNIHISESESDSDDSHIKLSKFLGMTALNVPERQSPEEELKDEYVNMMPNSAINVDSDEDLPTELPVKKNASSICENAEIDDMLQMVIPTSENDVVSDDEPPIELPIGKSSTNEIMEKNSHDIPNSAKDVDCDDESPIEVPVTKETSIKQISKRGVKTSSNSRNVISREYKENEPSRKTSLLEMLLVDDIRHERNVIMQCIRHIVKNDFFGVN